MGGIYDILVTTNNSLPVHQTSPVMKTTLHFRKYSLFKILSPLRSFHDPGYHIQPGLDYHYLRK